MGLDPNGIESQYESVSSHLAEHELTLLEQSLAAYVQIKKDETPYYIREAAARNREIVSVR